MGNREKVMEGLKKKGLKCDVATVGKQMGESWKALSAAEKAPYEAKAKAQKEEYDAYVKSEEGAAALKAHKDAVTEAKSSVKGAPQPEEKKGKRKAKADKGDAEDGEDAEDVEAAAKEPSPKKTRGRPPAQGKADDSKDPPKARGKAKAAPAPEQQSSLDAAILAEADKLGFRSAIQNLASRKDISEKDLKGHQLLSALKDSNGLVNKAKAILLAGA